MPDNKAVPVAIQRLLDEVAANSIDGYNRMHNRHNRSCYNRSLPPEPVQTPDFPEGEKDAG